MTIYNTLLIPIREHVHKDYSIEFANEFQEHWIEKIKNYHFTRHVIFTDENVYKNHKKVIEFLEENLKSCIVIVRPSGEEYKHIRYLSEIYEYLISKQIDRKSGILAVGGGVIGDFAGFVAATILRGIFYIQIPTTLLAMVDSSVGGKVAVNVNIGKNMVGAFYQPRAVFCNIDFLRTLPEREWVCGLVEMFKHALLNKKVYKNFKEVVLKNPNYWDWDQSIWAKLIYESVQVKASVVTQDEKESSLRSILNLGHTIGHALESLTHYKVFSHGEAVSRGLVTALLLSKKKWNFPEDLFEEVIRIMKELKLPLDTHDFSAESIWKHLLHDKKNTSGKVKYIYLKNIGEPIYSEILEFKDFSEIWNLQKQIFD